MSFITEQSFKCLLGPTSKNIKIENEIYSWSVGSKNHFTTSKELSEKDIPRLISLIPSTFYYMSISNIKFLNSYFKVSKSKNTSFVLNIENGSLSGTKYKKIRNSYNKCQKENLKLIDNYLSIDDIKIMIKDWSYNYTEKYFRDFSGKNKFFFINEYHKDCINLFTYKDKELLSFGILSPPKDGHSTYIIGKALYKKMPGIAEYTDIKLYEKARELGVKYVHMGKATKGLVFYKSKFPNSEKEIDYDGSIEIRSNNRT